MLLVGGMEDAMCLRLHFGFYFCRDSAHVCKAPRACTGFSLVAINVVSITVIGAETRSVLLQRGDDMAVRLVVDVEGGAIQAT